MDNTPEGENKQIHHSLPQHHELHLYPQAPVESAEGTPPPAPEAIPHASSPLPAENTPHAAFPAVPATPASNPPEMAPAAPIGAPSTPAIPTPAPTPAPANMPGTPAPGPGLSDESHHAGTLILQWLTYAFWGWTVLVLASLTFASLARLIGGDDTATFCKYTVAALIVLLPAAFITDSIYSQREPDRKTGAASLIMVVHAVIFALFTIGSLLFAAWSAVTLLTVTGDSGEKSSAAAYLISTLVVGIFYATAFIRTLNPLHISQIAEKYRLGMAVVVVLFAILGCVQPTFHNTPNANIPTSTCDSYSTTCPAKSKSTGGQFDSHGKLNPAQVGGTQCDIPTLSDGSTTGQVAVTGGATCDEAESNIQGANGKDGGSYKVGGYACTSTRQGGDTQWSSYWNDDFYSYSCTSGSKQVAFNLQTRAQNRNSSSLVTD